ncbi:MAG TPA: hypothetical protein VF862_07100 [Gemmatimonadales bacterium]
MRLLWLLPLMMIAQVASAQSWDDPATLALVDRAIARRQAAESSGLRHYRAEARGMVFFLAQVGPDPGAVPRLVKADQLRVEVYWEAPSRSKQIISAWRDQAWLPTDLRYHRDHLGIVTNDFGPVIRLGEGDEVRDVPHPLARTGRALYDFAPADSLVITTPQGAVRVQGVAVRPKDAGAPRAAGTLYLDAASGVLVRFQFSFTVAAYRQADLEGIEVVLENALFATGAGGEAGGSWLPWRQEIEIRRRTAWLEFPYRTTIRGRWELTDYDFDTPPPAGTFAAGPYGGMRAASTTGTWEEPLAVAVERELGAMARADLKAVRREVMAQLGPASVPQPPARLAFGSLSDVARVNRVQGLTLGAGLSLAPTGSRLTFRPTLGYGISNHRVTGGLDVSIGGDRSEVSMAASREVRDLSEWPSISGVLNSVLAQEGGHDYGDYVQLDQVTVTVRRALGRDIGLALTAAGEDPDSLAVAGTPSSGSFRANPPLGGPRQMSGRLRISRELPARPLAGIGLVVEGELGGREDRRGFGRVTLEVSGRTNAGPGQLEVSGRLGAGSGELPAHRSFVLGGRGTLPGSPYRAWGGRRMAWGRVEWRIPMGVPEARIGGMASTGKGMVLAPYVAAGWADRAIEGLPWAATDGVQPVLGLASELLFNVVRIEAGWAIRSRQVGVVADLSPGWWPIL